MTIRRLGKYRLIRRLAVGGMAEVYLAVAEGLSGFEKRVVVKRLLPQHAGDAKLLGMFLDEARLCAALRHPHVAEVYDVGEDGGEYFFAMEHVAGHDLRDVLEALHGEPLPLAEALEIVRAVAEGLHHAHERRDSADRLMNIVHRDVSPSNVLVGDAGEVKLIDFGVAKWAAQRTETRHGELKGKCAYMSPEQCRAEPLDRRSDLFSLGVVLYEITTGRRPHEGGNDFEVMTAIVQGTPVPPSARRPHYPPALERIVLRALAFRREDRYPTGRALADDVAAFAAGHHFHASAESIGAFVRELPLGGEEETAAPVEDGEAARAPFEETIPGTIAGGPPSTARTATDLHAVAAGRASGRKAGRRGVWVAVLAGMVVIAATAISMGVMRGREAREMPPATTAVTPPRATGASAAPPAATGAGPEERVRSRPPGQTKEAAAPAVSTNAPPPQPALPRARRGKGPGGKKRAGTALVAPPAPDPAPAPVRIWDPDSPVPP